MLDEAMDVENFLGEIPALKALVDQYKQLTKPGDRQAEEGAISREGKTGPPTPTASKGGRNRPTTTEKVRCRSRFSRAAQR